MNYVEKALAQCSAIVTSEQDRVMSLKQAGSILSASASVGGLGGLFDGHRDVTANRQRYALFHGWLYAAVNALASEAAEQPVNVGRLKGGRDIGPTATKGGKVLRSLRAKMTPTAYQKTARTEWEIIEDHPLHVLLDQPNTVQGRFQFVYSFVASLYLTGVSYIIYDESEEGDPELYSIPTTWVRPDHKEGPFTKFYIIDPKRGTMPENQKPLTREQVGFAFFPNPADPLGFMSPAAAQGPAIRIDDKIQSSQEQFFDQGIFPSVIVTVGQDPHPDGSPGTRPRLTLAQRRQVVGAIKKTMAGVHNYGNPAIVDGLIEKIEKLSATQNEMGWEKSEDAVRTRILSAFGVHPYILGEAVSVGGYAQVANIEKRFCKRVNVPLDMLSNLVSNFVTPKYKEPPKKAKPAEKGKPNNLFVWWEKTEAVDPSLQWSNLNSARTRGDVTKNEIREKLGLPPDETGGDRSKQWTSADVTAIATLQEKVASGAIDPEQGAALLEIAFDLEPEEAQRLAGEKSEAAVEQERMAAEQQQQMLDQGNAAKPATPGQQETAALEDATDELEKAIKALTSIDSFPVALIADQIVKSSEVEVKMNTCHDASGRFCSTDGGAASLGGRVANETFTAPPPGKNLSPSVEADPNGDGVTDSARVGVAAMSMPPPPGIPRLPRLTDHERQVEGDFIKAFEADPDGMASKLRDLTLRTTKAGEPATFGTDDAKVLSDKWQHPNLSLEERSQNRATLNLALHQTANAITKRAFTQHLDTLQPGDEIMVTVGGCGAGKGFALKNVPDALAVKGKSKAVWDSAGDQNATENPWVQKEAEKRGLKVNYVFVHADPRTQWAHPERGVVKRAGDPNDGRMVDAKVFADSYAIGAKNHQAFYERHKDNPNANFMFLANGNPPKQLDGIPKEMLNLDRKELAKFAIDTVMKDDNISPHVRRGATTGTRIWGDD